MDLLGENDMNYDNPLLLLQRQFSQTSNVDVGD